MTKNALMDITLHIDGEERDVAVKPHELLVDVLREKCGRTSVKEGCETGGCGACTVLIDGRPALACLTLALDATGREIRTVEGMSGPGERLHPLQEAFIAHHAVQCGFCTPGMLLVADALLKESPNASKDEIKAALSGNLCRCTGYVRIVDAIADVANSASTQSR